MRSERLRRAEMKIPKHIENALKKREKAAYDWNDADYIISRFIHQNRLEDIIDAADFNNGVEAIINPSESNERIREAIINKK